MLKKILADTSVWIDCFRYEGSQLAAFMRQCILSNKVVYNGIVMAELLQGCKDKKEYKRVATALEVMEFLEFNFDVWQLGSEISFSLRRKGKTAPLADCVIAAQCIHEKLQLLTNDKHFSQIQEVYPLQVVERPLK